MGEPTSPDDPRQAAVQAIAADPALLATLDDDVETIERGARERIDRLRRIDAITVGLTWAFAGLLLLGFLSLAGGRLGAQDAHQRRLATLLQAVVEDAPDGILVVGESGAIEIANREAGRLAGCPPGALIGRPIEDLVPEELREAHRLHRAHFEASPRARAMGAGLPLELRRPDGSRLPVDVSLSPLRNGLGPRTIAVFRDVSDRVALARQVDAHVEELRRSNRDLEQFASVASHDLKEPLRTVSRFVQLLERRHAGRLDPDAAEFIGFAVDGCRRMEEMIDGILAYSRIVRRTASSGPSDSGQVLDEVLQWMAPAIEESGATVTRDVLPVVAVDRTLLGRLFQNLLGNAVKFRGAGPPTIRISARRDGDAWTFSVEDDGIGIDPGSRERVFGLFQRLHSREAYPGSGLGLAICRRIVETFGGWIRVADRPGPGTTIEFALPATTGGMPS